MNDHVAVVYRRLESLRMCEICPNYSYVVRFLQFPGQRRPVDHEAKVAARWQQVTRQQAAKVPSRARNQDIRWLRQGAHSVSQ